MRTILFKEVQTHLQNPELTIALEKEFEKVKAQLVTVESVKAEYFMPKEDAERNFALNEQQHVIAYILGCETKQLQLDNIVQLFAEHTGFAVRFEPYSRGYLFERHQSETDIRQAQGLRHYYSNFK